MVHLEAGESHFLHSIPVQYWDDTHRTEHDHPEGEIPILPMHIPYSLSCLHLLHDFVFPWTIQILLQTGQISLYTTNWYDLTQMFIRNYFNHSQTGELSLMSSNVFCYFLIKRQPPPMLVGYELWCWNAPLMASRNRYFNTPRRKKSRAAGEKAKALKPELSGYKSWFCHYQLCDFGHISKCLWTSMNSLLQCKIFMKIRENVSRMCTLCHFPQ